MALRAAIRSLAFLAGLFAFMPCARAGAVEDWLEFLRARNGTALPTRVAERVRIEQEEWRLRALAADEITEGYFAGRNLGEVWRAVDAENRRGDLQPALSGKFLDHSLEVLSRAPITSIRSFVASLDRDALRFGLSFRPPVQHAPEKGGFHRGSGSVYMNLEKVPHDEWMLIFMHELLHGLDDELRAAVPIFNDRALARDVAEWGRTRKLEGLSTAERARLDAWLRAGLDRGLLAEHRAWLVTMRLYQAGVKHGMWAKIGWVEALLAQRKKGESLRRFLYRFLDERFPDPREGIFAWPLVQARLKQIRSKLRRNPPAPQGKLGALLTETR